MTGRDADHPTVRCAAGLSWGARLIARLVAVPLALALLYACGFAALYWCDAIERCDYIELTPAAGRQERGTLWQFATLDPALSPRMRDLFAGFSSPGCTLLSWWARRAPQAGDPLLIRLRTRFLSQLPPGKTYDSLVFMRFATGDVLDLLGDGTDEAYALDAAGVLHQDRQRSFR